MDTKRAKMAAGFEAAKLIENDMTVGLGSGTTAAYFIEALVERAKNGLKIRAVSSSKKSEELAKKGPIQILDLNDAFHIDITVDGADEIDPLKRMIKGGGGALLREKILASSSKEMVVIIDESKKVEKLGRGKLPIEIASYGYQRTIDKLNALSLRGKIREEDKMIFITENHNFIYDIEFDSPIHEPEKLDQKILNIPGVVETGFFFSLAKRVIVGKNDGTTSIST